MNTKLSLIGISFPNDLDLTDKTKDTYLKYANEFSEWAIDNLNGSDPTKADMIRYKHWLSAKYSALSVNKRLTALRLFFKRAAEEHALENNIMDGIRNYSLLNTLKLHALGEDLINVFIK